MRRPLKKKHTLQPDSIYESENVTKLINYVMKSGKKNTARRIVYAAMEELKGKDGKNDPVALFDTAVKNVAPLMEVRSRRVGGANYQVPREVRPERRLALALRWIVDAANAGKAQGSAHARLAAEIQKAANEEGEAVKKRENTHKMAEANKAFAHFAW